MAVSKVILNGSTLIDTTDKTVTSASMLSGVTALKNDGTTVTGNIANGSATTPTTTITANPTISVSNSGLITASVSGSQSVTPTVSAGYVSSGTSGTITVNGSNTSQLTAKSAQTYTPTTTDQTIASGQYLTGVQTIKGDANLVAGNIKKGVVIFGITGTYEGDAPSSYTVTVSLTNPRNQGDFSSCNVIEAKSNDINDPNNINRSPIVSPIGSAEYELSSSSYGLFLVLYGSSVDIDDQSSVTITCTGGCSYSIVDVDTISVQVVGDGTITIDGVDYDY